MLVVALAVLAALLVLRNLDAGLVKTRLRALAQDRAGLELDYATAEIDLLSGLSLGELVVASPPGFRHLAPALLRVERITLGWSLSTAGPTMQKLTARGLELTVVVDEHGRTSLDSLGGAPQQPPRKQVAPGRLLAQALESIPEFDRIAFSRVAVNVLRTRKGKVVSRTRLEGVGGRALAKGAGASRSVELHLGRPERPLALAISYEGEGGRGDASGTFALDGQLDAHAADLHGRATLARQSISPGLGVGPLLALDASARADGDRLQVEVQRLEAVEGAVAAKGALSVEPGRVRVASFSGQADLARLAKLVPRDALGVECREGRLSWDVAQLWFLDEPRLEAGGHVALDGRVAALRVERGGARLDLDEVRLAAKGTPAGDGGVEVAIDLPIGLLRLARGEDRLEVRDLGAEAHAAIVPGPDHADLKLRFASVSAGDALSATGGVLEARLADLRVDAAHPLTSSGQAALSLALATLDAKHGERAVQAGDLRLAGHARLLDGRPGPIDLELPVGHVEVRGRGDRALLPSGPAKLTARLDHLHLDPETPLRSTGEGTVALALGAPPSLIDFRSQLKKEPDAVAFDVALDAQRTSLLTSFAPARLGLRGSRMALKVASKGRVEGLGGAPRLAQKGRVHVDRPSVTLAGSTLSADALDVTLDSDGTPRRQRATLTVAPRALALDGDALGDGRVSLTADVDADRPAVDLRLDGEGEALPQGHLALAASWNGKARTLAYRVDGDLGHLAALEPILPASLTDEHWIDLSDVRAKIEGHGDLGGLVEAIDPRGVPRFAPHPLATLRGDASIAVGLENVRYVDAAGVELVVPSVSVVTRVVADGERRTVHNEVHLARAELTANDHKVTVVGLEDSLDATSEGDPLVGAVHATHSFRLARLEQDVERLYPIADVRFETRARHDGDGTFHLEELLLENGRTGTTLRAEGELVLPRARPSVEARRLFGRSAAEEADDTPPLAGFKSLGLHTTLTQRLDGIDGDPAHLRGHGTVTVETRVDSGDLRRFHVASDTRFDDATIELPSAHVTIDRLDGLVPIVEDVIVRAGKATLLPTHEPNLYPALRFSDQHPFLSGPGALRVERVIIGELALDKVAGSLRVVRNRVALDQLEAEVRGGRVAGQLLVDWRGRDTTAQMKVRATGVEASRSRERFDANLALSLSAATRTLDGRAEILRIGRHHMLDLLDEVDPHKKDAGMNRIRSALDLGWPEHVRLLFDHGFASFEVAFGGLARLVHVGEVRGVPTGPLVERYLGALLTSESP